MSFSCIPLFAFSLSEARRQVNLVSEKTPYRDKKRANTLFIHTLPMSFSVEKTSFLSLVLYVSMSRVFQLQLRPPIHRKHGQSFVLSYSFSHKTFIVCICVVGHILSLVYVLHFCCRIVGIFVIAKL